VNGRPAGSPGQTPRTAEEEVELQVEQAIDDLARTAWGELPPSVAERRDDAATLDCGWGRLVFGQTFPMPSRSRTPARREAGQPRHLPVRQRSARRGRAGPQRAVPRPLAHLPPAPPPVPPPTQPGPGSGCGRCSSRTTPRRSTPLPAQRHGHRSERAHLEQPADLGLHLPGRRGRRHRAVIGTVMGVDHVEAFADPEGGTSLWCLAVDPQSSRPASARRSTRTLAERYQALGRRWLDLSVMHDNRAGDQAVREARLPPGAGVLHQAQEPDQRAAVRARRRARSGRPQPVRTADRGRGAARGIEVEVLDARWGELRLTSGGRSIVTRESCPS
jgi:ribosomal protein S18 acetylase RimI-like enzyme